MHGSVIQRQHQVVAADRQSFRLPIDDELVAVGVVSQTRIAAAGHSLGLANILRAQAVRKRLERLHSAEAADDIAILILQLPLHGYSPAEAEFRPGWTQRREEAAENI